MVARWGRGTAGNDQGRLMTWPPLQQDWPPESVRVVANGPAETPTGPAVERSDGPADTERHILTEAHRHLRLAVEHLVAGVSWLGIVDGRDRGQVIRDVAAVLDTVEYRRQL